MPNGFCHNPLFRNFSTKKEPLFSKKKRKTGVKNHLYFSYSFACMEFSPPTKKSIFSNKATMTFVPPLQHVQCVLCTETGTCTLMIRLMELCRDVQLVRAKTNFVIISDEKGPFCVCKEEFLLSSSVI